MHFVFALALGMVALVVAPYLAHRLRRRRGDERPFAAAHLVPPAPPRARRRSKLEDRALFGVRAISILGLALLGASPLVRCSRLALERSSGASVAMTIVLDDSMSMRTRSVACPTRFERACEGARELLASAREGDAVAIVLAGAPARVALAATTDLAAARSALDALRPSDCATDLDGALTMARALIARLPQVDRRIVLLSDLADGHPDGPPIGEGSELPTWVAMPELRTAAKDCGVVVADRVGLRVRVRVACSHDATPVGREITLMRGDEVLGAWPRRPPRLARPPRRCPTAQPRTRARSWSSPAKVERSLSSFTSPAATAIAAGRRAPVVTEARPGMVVVADAV